MENIASPINNDEGGLTLSDDTGGKSCEEYNILLDKLEKKTDEFMKTIGTTKTVQVYPLDDIAYKKLEAFITSADNIIKWYELDKSRSKTTIDKLLNEVTVSNQACKDVIQKFVESQKATKQKGTDLEQLLSKMVLDGEKKTKDFEEKIEQMKIAQNEMEKKIKEFEQKEAVSKVQIDTKSFQVEVLTLNVKEKDDKINYLKQKLQGTYRLPQAQNENGHDLQRTVELEAKMAEYEDKIEQMKIAQNEMEKKIKEFEQKEAQSKVQIDTKSFQVEFLTLNVKEKDDKINYLKQKLQQANRLPQAQNGYDHHGIVQLEAKMAEYEAKIAQMNREKDEKVCSK